MDLDGYGHMDLDGYTDADCCPHVAASRDMPRRAGAVAVCSLGWPGGWLAKFFGPRLAAQCCVEVEWSTKK